MGNNIEKATKALGNAYSEQGGHDFTDLWDGALDVIAALYDKLDDYDPEWQSKWRRDYTRVAEENDRLCSRIKELKAGIEVLYIERDRVIHKLEQISELL